MGSKISTLIVLGVILAIMWLSLDTSFLSIPAASITGADQWGWNFAIGWRALVSFILGVIGWAVFGGFDRVPPSGPVEPSAPTKPTMLGFETWELYDAAKDQYFEDMMDYKVAAALKAERKRRGD